MAQIALPNTYVAGTTASASQVNANEAALLNGHNNHDSGSSIWTIVSGATFKRNSTTIFPILQIVTATSTTAFTGTSSTFAATNLSTSITPSSTSSKIAIFASGTLAINASGVAAYATIAKDGVNILGANGQFALNVAAGNNNAPATLIYVDSPATTSAKTYAVYIRNSNNSTAVAWGGTNETQFLALVEIGY